MQDRFKFRAVLKTDTHSVITETYYIFDNGYLVNIDDVQKPFEKKYPDDCFWEFLEEIEKQKNCQEVSTDSEIIIFNSFDGLIQCTGLKDKNGKLIYEGDIVYKKGNKDHKGNKMFSTVVWCSMYAEFNISDENGLHRMPSNPNNVEIIGNIYESPELLEKNNVQ